MLHKKTLRLLSKRGEFYIYESIDCKDCIEVYLGPFDESESDFITVINKSLVPDLIAALRGTDK